MRQRRTTQILQNSQLTLCTNTRQQSGVVLCLPLGVLVGVEGVDGGGRGANTPPVLKDSNTFKSILRRLSPI